MDRICKNCKHFFNDESKESDCWGVCDNDIFHFVNWQPLTQLGYKITGDMNLPEKTLFFYAADTEAFFRVFPNFGCVGFEPKKSVKSVTKLT